MRRYKIYAAGPEVFLQNATEFAEVQREICKKYDFIALHPMDNNIHFKCRDLRAAMSIYLGDINQVRACDILAANCNPFRGSCMDDGTAYELGYGNGLGKPSYGYITKMIPEVEKIVRYFNLTKKNADGLFVDNDGYLVLDDFGMSINLMMQCGMLHSKGRLIEGKFEQCISTVRTDIELGRISIAT